MNLCVKTSCKFVSITCTRSQLITSRNSFLSYKQINTRVPKRSKGSRRLHCFASDVEKEASPPPWVLTGGDVISTRSDAKLTAKEDLKKQQETDEQALAALSRLASTLEAVPNEMVTRMSFDQQRDLRDLAFELQAQQEGLELAPPLQEPLAALSSALFTKEEVEREDPLTLLSSALFDQEEGEKTVQQQPPQEEEQRPGAVKADLPAAAKAVREIILPPYASQDRAIIAGRFLRAARYGAMFERTKDPENDQYVVSLSDAVGACAVALSLGTRLEAATSAALKPPPTRPLSIIPGGPALLHLTATQAMAGAGVAFTLAYACERLATTYIQTTSPDIAIIATSPTDSIAIKVQLERTLGDLTIYLGYGGTALSLVVGIALLVLAAQLVEENFQEMES